MFGGHIENIPIYAISLAINPRCASSAKR